MQNIIRQMYKSNIIKLVKMLWFAVHEMDASKQG